MNINMAVLSATAKSPNLNHHQYFRIYSIIFYMYHTRAGYDIIYVEHNIDCIAEVHTVITIVL